MTDPIVPLLMFCRWTLALVVVTAAGRGLLVLSGRARADDCPAYQYESRRFLYRAAPACLNALETLPLFAAPILAAYRTGQTDQAIDPAIGSCWPGSHKAPCT